MCGLLVMRDISATSMRENTFYDQICEYLLIAFKEQSWRAERDVLSFVNPPHKTKKKKKNCTAKALYGSEKYSEGS